MEKRNFSQKDAASGRSRARARPFVVHAAVCGAKTCARARIYPAAFTTRRPSGIPDEITRCTADIRAKLMHVFNSAARWSPHCRERRSAPGKLLPVNPRRDEKCLSRGWHLVLREEYPEYIEAETRVSVE